MSTIQNLNNGETGLSHRNKLNTNFSNLNTDKVETSVTVNGHALSSNVTLTTDDVAEGSTNKYDEVVALLAGAGIQVTGTYPNFTVTNTSPDQVVSLAAGTNVTITGTYPNFTIAATGGGGSGDMTKAVYDPANIAEQLVGITATQTLTNKTTTSLLLNLASPKYSTTASIDSGGATTVLTSASNGQIENGSTGANIVQLPVASTMQIGQYFIIRNDGANTNPLTINSSGGNLVYSLPSGENIRVELIKNTGTDASSWRVEQQFVPITRAITINGVTQDLSDDRSWTISAGGPSIVAEFATSGTAYDGVVYEKSGRAFTVTSLLISLATLPVGGNFEVNVKKNGTTILSGNLVITTTESASNSLYVVQTGDSGKATISTSSFSSKDRLTIEVVAGSGNTFLGAGVNIQLIGTIS